MFGAIKRANEAVRAGNAYRLEKYGKPDTFAESQRKAREWVKWYKENCVPERCTMKPEEIDSFKERFQYWEEWTGGRFQIRENPNPTERTVHGTYCRSNPVTGKWEAK